MTAEDRREDRDAKLRERARGLCWRAVISPCTHSNGPCEDCERIYAALRQTEEEALQRGKEHAEQMHAALGGKSPASSPEND